VSAVRLILLPLLILAAGLGVTWAVWDHDQQASRHEVRSQFNFALGDAVGRIEQRMATYEQMLRGVHGMFAVSGTLDRDQFHDYLKAINLDANLSGVQAVGVVKWVPAADRDAHVAALGGTGVAGYSIHPGGRREAYAPIVQREPPADGDPPVLGFDTWFNPERRLALQRSRDSGSAIVSGKVQLAVDTRGDEEPGFVMYLPVYRRGLPQETAAQRRDSLVGWVYASFRMREVIASLYGEQPPGISLALYDGVEPSATALLYRSPEAGGSSTDAVLSANEYLVVGGHDWMLSMTAHKAFEERFGRNSQAVIAWTGTGLSLLLALLAWAMASGRSRAMRLASLMTRELRESEEKFRALADCTVNLEVWWGLGGRPRWINPSVKEYTGYTVEECMAMRDLAGTLIHPEDMPRVAPELLKGQHGLRGNNLEFRCLRKDGSVLWLSVSWGPIHDARGVFTGFRISGRDITERKLLDAERKIAEDKIRELAFFDALTRLPNRTLLADRLKQAIAVSAQSGASGALLFIDVDNFKTLNDTLGHDKGDLLLQQVAQRLSASVREGDTVARVGGDEFVVVLGNLSGNRQLAASETEAVGEKIRTILGKTYHLDGVEYRSTASIGVTVFNGHHASIDELLKQADLAMYKSKERGRNAMRFFDPAMQTVVVARAALEAGLRKAVDEDLLLLHYQAQVTVDNRITGAEALVRWQHPERGIIFPAEFVPLAEEAGLIHALGDRVLRAACLQLARWSVQPDLAHLTIAVNVSVHQFREPDFVARVLAVIGETGSDPRRLKLELTESVLVDNVEDIAEKMHALKDSGVVFSLDDFGIGYSSLSYLKRLPLDQLKIDRSFVRDILVDPNDAAIAKTIVALGKSLALEVIAEGVETAAQRDFLADAGCHAYQGYFFCHPVQVEGFEAFVRRFSQRHRQAAAPAREQVDG